MSLDLAFDSVAVNNDAIIGFKTKTEVFDQQFMLGQTLCRQSELKVLKSYILAMPTEITWTHPDGSTISQHIDSIDDTDDTYYTLDLLDNMVLLNEEIDLSTYTTAGQALEAICTYFSITHNLSNVDPVYSYAFAWDGRSTPRDVVGMIAECLGAFAVFAGSQLRFKMYSQTAVDTISMDDCADYALGDQHVISGIVWDNGVDVYEYGNDSTEEVFLNPNNLLLGDANTLTKIQEFGAAIVGLTFNNLTVTECPVATAAAGDLISLGGHNIIVQEDYTFYGDWVGGYDLQLQTAPQKLTNVKTSAQEILSIHTEIDRQQGTLDIIGQKTTDMETELVHFMVDAGDQSVKVSNQDDPPFTSYTSFKEDGMRIYVDGEADPVAEATAERFECHKGLGVQDWAIVQGTNNGELVLNFFRKPVS